MLIEFSKYQGAGNDFVILNNTSRRYDALTTRDIALLCDRRFGIGADGLLLLSPDTDHAFRMVYYNQDGSRATFCGNGARCLAHFAVAAHVAPPSTPFSFIADDGAHTATVNLPRNWVNLQMSPVTSVRQLSPNSFQLNTGVPHYVEFVPNLDALDIMALAPAIRHSPRFQPDGVNVNFVQILSPNHIALRTYERGVEAETLACGTGITASAIATSLLQNPNPSTSPLQPQATPSIPNPSSPIPNDTTNPNPSTTFLFHVQAQGGNLQVSFTQTSPTQFPSSPIQPAPPSFTNIHLCGPATPTFHGATDSLPTN